MTTGIILDRRYLDHNMGAWHPESPQRLEAVYGMIEAGLPFSLEIIPPRLAADREIEYVHACEYVAMIKQTSGKPHVSLDPDTSTSAKSYETALLAAGGAIAAADAIMDNRIANAFALVRPPGHHAEFREARGFCLFNNVAIAAEHLLRTRGLKRILIADWDLHHGNGTQHAFYSRKDVLYFSTHQYPYYPGTGSWRESGAGEGEGFTVNVPLRPGKGDGDYVFIYRTILGRIAASFQPEFILVSAGFDIYAGDPLGGMSVTGKGFGALASELAHMAEKLCQDRILFVLEGGYDLEGLAEGVKRVLGQLSGEAETVLVRAEISDETRREIEPVLDVQGKYWPL
jgi:acetoin utilization deacetylase AcuC-like enzyme